MAHPEPADPARRSSGNRAPARPTAALRVTIVAVATFAAACVALRVDRADPNVMFSYGSDALLQAAWAKTLLEQRWIHRNPALGAPFGQLYYDFPLFEWVNFVAQKALGWMTGSWVWAVNGYYLLTFPAAAVCAYAALVALGVSALPAGVMGFAYALLPYHFYRGEVHLFLAGYHFVPLAVLVALWIARGDLPALRDGPRRPWRLAVAVLVMALTAGSGIYYGFFTAWFLFVAAVYAVVRFRSWRPMILAGALGTILVVGGVLNVAPSIAYWRTNGATPVVRRLASDSFVWGFRLSSALLPMPHHRFGTLGRLRQSYGDSVRSALNYDDFASSFGIVASLGFLGMFVLALSSATPARARETLRATCWLTGAGVLLATTGGLGQLLASFVTPGIRSWDRIVPFLAFFALATVAIALDLLAARSRPRGRALVAAGTVALGVVAFVDQTSPHLVPDYETSTWVARGDRAFFGDMERALPAGTAVFQLPYVPFPESGRTDLPDYDMLRPYLNTTALRWSYGAVRTRFADAWIRSVAMLPPDRLVDALVIAGFGGILVDRRGYPDRGAALDAALRPLTGPAIGPSPDGHLVWYRLDGAAAALRARIGENEWTRRSAALLHPFYVEWQDGFYDREGTDDRNQRWSASRGTLAIDNPKPEPARVRLKADACGAWPEPASLVMRSATLDDSISIDARCAPLDVATTLPPGRTFIRFETDGRRANVRTDPRRLYFHLHDFRLVIEDADRDVIENR